MNRKEKVQFINEKVLPTAKIDNGNWLAYGREMVMGMVKAMSEWRKGKPVDIEMNAELVDGVFYINGEALARVAPKLPTVEGANKSNYWEGRILARQEWKDVA